MVRRDRERVEQVRAGLKDHNIDVVICGLPSNVLMLTGYFPVVGTTVAIFNRDGEIRLLTIWFFSLGESYGVNPLIFGVIYVGEIPFFSLSIGWLVRNYRRGGSIALPALTTLFFFISAYLCLTFAGKNVALWVYGIVVLMVLFGIASTLQNIRKQLNDASQPGGQAAS